MGLRVLEAAFTVCESYIFRAEQVLINDTHEKFPISVWKIDCINSLSDYLLLLASTYVYVTCQCSR